MNRQTRAYAYALTAVLFWSTAATAFALTLRVIDGIALLFGASLTSFAVLGAIVAATGKYKLLGAVTAGQWTYSAFMGLLNPFLYYLLLFYAYSVLSAQEALVLNYTWPVMLVLLSIPLLRQPLTIRSAASFAICFAGVMTIAMKGNLLAFRFTNPAGVAVALLSAVVWALYWIFNVRDSRDEILKLFLNFLFGSLFCAAAFLIRPGSHAMYLAGIAGAAYVGLFEMGVTFVLWLMGLKLTTSAARVSVFVYLSPFLSLALIGTVVGERIALSTLAGLSFIVAGIVLHQTKPANAESARRSREIKPLMTRRDDI